MYVLLSPYALPPVKITSLSSQKHKGKSRTDSTAVTLVVTQLLICSYDGPFSPSFLPLHPPKPTCNSQVPLNTTTGCRRSISPYLWPRVDLQNQWTRSWLPAVPLPAEASPMISNHSPGTNTCRPAWSKLEIKGHKCRSHFGDHKFAGEVAFEEDC